MNSMGEEHDFPVFLLPPCKGNLKNRNKSSSFAHPTILEVQQLGKNPRITKTHF